MRNSPPPPFKGNISVAHCMPLSTRLKGSTIMSPPGFQTQLRPPVTLNFDLLTPEIDHLCPFHAPRGDLCQFAWKSVHSFSKNERTSVQTNGRRDRSRTLCVWPVQTGVRINTVSYKCSLPLLRSCVFITLSAFCPQQPSFLSTSLGKGGAGSSGIWDKQGKRVGKKREKAKIGMHEKNRPKMQHIWHLGTPLGSYRRMSCIFIARQHTDARH